jgi:hypothetical protein
MNIIDALSKQKKQESVRVMCDDGFLSISDAVFSVALYNAMYVDIYAYMTDIKLEERGKFLKQIGA